MYPLTIKLVLRTAVLSLSTNLVVLPCDAQVTMGETTLLMQYLGNDNSIASPYFEQPAQSDAVFTTNQETPIYSTAINRDRTNKVDFNDLWIMQYQEDYDHKVGGAALGKILRMSLKSFYRNYRGVGTINSNYNSSYQDDEFNGNYADIGYSLHLNSDRIRLGVEYQF